MKYSKLFGKTKFSDQKGSGMISHQLLTRGGFIAESVAGRYFFLPLGWRVHQKIAEIVRQEMDEAGGQEMLSPTLHPLELWEETNRTNTAGFELMKVADRRGAEFALGGTAEEMFVDVVRKFQISHKELPFLIYQFSNKFRDEMRARGGLLRVREFIMKDGYSFDRDAESFKKIYDTMAETYHRIFQRVGLDTVKVAADNGYIGGEYCHEFQAEHPDGEGRFFLSESGEYAAHEDVATFTVEAMNPDEKIAEYQEIDAKRGTTMEDGVKLHGLPLWKQIKDVMFVDDQERLILAVIRGDLDVNEIKLQRAIGAHSLRSATEEEIRDIGTEPGFISPVGLQGKALIVGDVSLRTVINAYGGANKLNRDALNVNIDRDYQLDIETDIAMAQAGLTAEDGSKLVEKRGIEVGNIFQLGHHYTTRMDNATFVDADNSAQPYYMGCYGIGIGRTMAAIAEKYHDDNGLMWPAQIAPFTVHFISMLDESEGEKVYQQLRQAGIDVLWDDRDTSAGIKFGNADLIGCPVRLVISRKTDGKVEWKERGSDQTELLDLENAIERINSLTKNAQSI